MKQTKIIQGIFFLTILIFIFNNAFAYDMEDYFTEAFIRPVYEEGTGDYKFGSEMYENSLTPSATYSINVQSHWNWTLDPTSGGKYYGERSFSGQNQYNSITTKTTDETLTCTQNNLDECTDTYTITANNDPSTGSYTRINPSKILDDSEYFLDVSGNPRNIGNTTKNITCTEQTVDVQKTTTLYENALWCPNYGSRLCTDYPEYPGNVEPGVSFYEYTNEENNRVVLTKYPREFKFGNSIISFDPEDPNNRSLFDGSPDPIFGILPREESMDGSVVINTYPQKILQSRESTQMSTAMILDVNISDAIYKGYVPFTLPPTCKTVRLQPELEARLIYNLNTLTIENGEIVKGVEKIILSNWDDLEWTRTEETPPNQPNIEIFRLKFNKVGDDIIITNENIKTIYDKEREQRDSTRGYLETSAYFSLVPLLSNDLADMIQRLKAIQDTIPLSFEIRDKEKTDHNINSNPVKILLTEPFYFANMIDDSIKPNEFSTAMNVLNVITLGSARWGSILIRDPGLKISTWLGPKVMGVLSTKISSGTILNRISSFFGNEVETTLLKKVNPTGLTNTLAEQSLRNSTTTIAEQQGNTVGKGTFDKIKTKITQFAQNSLKPGKSIKLNSDWLAARLPTDLGGRVVAVPLNFKPTLTANEKLILPNPPLLSRMPPIKNTTRIINIAGVELKIPTKALSNSNAGFFDSTRNLLSIDIAHEEALKIINRGGTEATDLMVATLRTSKHEITHSFTHNLIGSYDGGPVSQKYAALLDYFRNNINLEDALRYTAEWDYILLNNETKTVLLNAGYDVTSPTLINTFIATQGAEGFPVVMLGDGRVIQMDNLMKEYIAKSYAEGVLPSGLKTKIEQLAGMNMFEIDSVAQKLTDYIFVHLDTIGSILKHIKSRFTLVNVSNSSSDSQLENKLMLATNVSYPIYSIQSFVESLPSEGYSALEEYPVTVSGITSKKINLANYGKATFSAPGLFEFDVDGNIVKEIRLDDGSATFTFDSDGRILKEVVFGTDDKVYIYTGNNLTKIVQGDQETIMTYDGEDNLLTEETTNGGIYWYSFEYTYNSEDQLIKEKTIQRSIAGLLTTVTMDYTYDASSYLTKIVQDNGLETQIDYISNGVTQDISQMRYYEDNELMITEDYNLETGQVIATNYTAKMQDILEMTLPPAELEGVTFKGITNNSSKGIYFQEENKQQKISFEAPTLLATMNYFYDENGDLERTELHFNGKDINSPEIDEYPMKYPVLAQNYCSTVNCNKWSSFYECPKQCAPAKNFICPLGYIKTLYSCQQTEICGNGLTEPALEEECDTFGESDSCTADCKLKNIVRNVCGNGVKEDWEQCDSKGIETSTCTSDCFAINTDGNYFILSGDLNTTIQRGLEQINEIISQRKDVLTAQGNYLISLKLKDVNITLIEYNQGNATIRFDYNLAETKRPLCSIINNRTIGQLKHWAGKYYTDVKPTCVGEVLAIAAVDLKCNLTTGYMDINPLNMCTQNCNSGVCNQPESCSPNGSTRCKTLQTENLWILHQRTVSQKCQNGLWKTLNPCTNGCNETTGECN